MKEAFKNDLKLEIVVPEDGTIYTPSVVILNRYAPKPELAKAFPRPIRYVAGNLTVPGEIKARWLPDDAYAGKLRTVTDWDKFNMADFVQKWTSEVAP